MGASIEALRDIVRSYKPAVLHFSGHGNADGELLLEGTGGAAEPLNGEALGAWLETRRERTRLLVLNACHGAVRGLRAWLCADRVPPVRRRATSVVLV